MEYRLERQWQLTRRIAFLAVLWLPSIGFARIGGTSDEFNKSEFARVLFMVRKSESAQGDGYLGAADTLVVVFKGADGRITKQRLKWLGNKLPPGKVILATFIAFVAEATGTNPGEADWKTLVDKAGKMVEEEGSGFSHRGYTITTGEFTGAANGVGEGHIMIEVSR